MAAAPPPGGADPPQSRWPKFRLVYTRKKSTKPKPQPSSGTPAAGEDDDIPGPARASPPLISNPSFLPYDAPSSSHRCNAAASASGGSGRVAGSNGHDVGLTALFETERVQQRKRELRQRVVADLELVRGALGLLDAKQVEIMSAAVAANAVAAAVSQFSGTDPGTPIFVKHTTPALGLFTLRTTSAVPHLRPPAVQVPAAENFPSLSLEKRTPKANQLYRNSEFLLANDKFPPVDSRGQKKSKGSDLKRHHGDSGRKIYSQAFKKCGLLLSKLMKHQFGWVFNKPVDPVALAIPDYFSIIKNPMDLGTIKHRLSKNYYLSPKEFADDVRLTFSNAMTYNPKGQDVHFMAEQMLQIFEAEWPLIEQETVYLSQLPPPKRVALPAIDIRVLERSGSTAHAAATETAPRPFASILNVGRQPAPKKPKAKDLHKREMTFEEKNKLSENLQQLPMEKLDVVVQIIKSKNVLLGQSSDEIEVDIDSMDNETLWELDRFVTNYKKNQSKQKRKAELARQKMERNAPTAVQERASASEVNLENVEPNAREDQSKHGADGNIASSEPAQDESKRETASVSSSSSSSSSSSGSSSSSDSDSDSSRD